MVSHFIVCDDQALAFYSCIQPVPEPYVITCIDLLQLTAKLEFYRVPYKLGTQWHWIEKWTPHHKQKSKVALSHV